MTAPELPCYCINLDDRSDRWEGTQLAFKGSGITPKRFPATRHSEGWRGCGASHVSAIKEAKRSGYKWVLIVEDDCTPAAGFRERWPALRDNLWATQEKWDVFLGGPTQVHGPAQHLTESIILIGHGYALHFYVICARNYDIAIQWDADRHGPIDVYFRDVFQIATVNPLIAIQRPSPSDIRGIDVDYSDIFSDSEEALQKLSYGERTRFGTVALLFASIGLIAYIWKRSK
jgi:GR25 family glycosyltransferase involved in LPS biosynthesis